MKEMQLSALYTPDTETIFINGEEAAKPRVVYCETCLFPVSAVDKRIKGTLFHILGHREVIECSRCGQEAVACQKLVASMLNPESFICFGEFACKGFDAFEGEEEPGGLFYGEQVTLLDKIIWVSISPKDLKKSRKWLSKNKVKILEGGNPELLLILLEDQVVSIDEVLQNMQHTHEAELLLFQYAEARIIPANQVTQLLDKLEELKPREDYCP